MEINDFMRNWDILQRKVRMIILIDTISTSRQTLDQIHRRGSGGIDGKRDSADRNLIVRLQIYGQLKVTLDHSPTT